jgi:hypothetical protein
MRTIGLILRLSRPLFLFGAALLYALGAGIAHYLGFRIDWDIFLTGQLWVSLLQLSTHYLNEYYDAAGDQQNSNRTLLSGGSGAIGPGKLPRRVAGIILSGSPGFFHGPYNSLVETFTSSLPDHGFWFLRSIFLFCASYPPGSKWLW